MPKPTRNKTFLDRIKLHAPEALDTQVAFDAVLAHILRADPNRLDIMGRRKRKRRIKGRNSKQTKTISTTRHRQSKPTTDPTISAREYQTTSIPPKPPTQRHSRTTPKQ